MASGKLVMVEEAIWVDATRSRQVPHESVDAAFLLAAAGDEVPEDVLKGLKRARPRGDKKDGQDGDKKDGQDGDKKDGQDGDKKDGQDGDKKDGQDGDSATKKADG